MMKRRRRMSLMDIVSYEVISSPLFSPPHLLSALYLQERLTC